MVEDEEFARLVGPFRRELLAYCYRMLGSVHDAEDLVQETCVRAWRAYDSFEGRSSLRTWLYRIATNACLRELERGSRRPLPSGLGAPSDEPERTPAAQPEIPWLQPVPDALVGAGGDDPAAVVASRAGLRLALVAAWQHLPPKGRSVLILRDVLGWHAAEVAELLDTTTAAVNSALQRARTQLAQAAPVQDEITEPADPGLRAVLDQFAAAFENADVPALLRLLTQDAVLEMPPMAAWFAGPDAIGRFFASRVLAVPGAFRLVPTAANGQPAFACYLRGPDGLYHADAISVLTMVPSGIARITVFLDTRLFAAFGMPEVHPAQAPASSPRP